MNAPISSRVLRSYQQRLATFLYECDAAFAIAPLGAGKGAAALTAIADLIRDGERRHALVIAPKLVATTVWPVEIASWPHLQHLRAAVLDGGPERRQRLLAAAPEREVTMIGIDLVPWLVSELAAIATGDHPLFDVLIIDETSRFKNPSGKRARALLKIAGRFRTRWGLTGTPRPNSSQDLFMPAAIITDGALWGRAFIPWQKRHFRPGDPFGREWVALPGERTRSQGHRSDFESERARSDQLMAELLTTTANLMAAKEVTSRLEGENAILRTLPKPPSVPSVTVVPRRSLWRRLRGAV
jgi:hypothetical protein